MTFFENWFFLSLACAFFAATTATLCKIILKKTSAIFILWIVYAFSLPLFLFVLLNQPPLRLPFLFWKTIVLLVPIEITGLLLYLRALKISPLSLSFPFLGLTPVFTILTASVILKERLHPIAIGGVFLVSLGAYLLNANTIREGGILAPIKNIYREKGSMIMILVAFIFSVTSTLGKKAILLSSVAAFPGIYFSILFAVITPIAFVKMRGVKKMAFTKGHILLFVTLGIIFGVSFLFHCKAISLVKVPYMISVKRLSLLMSVLYGAIIFKEKNIGFRVLGSFVMLCGVVVLVLAQ